MSVPSITKPNYRYWTNQRGILNENPNHNYDENDVNTFYHAIRTGNLSSVKDIVEKKPWIVFIKIFGDKKRSALYLASFFGRYEIVEYLVSRGASSKLVCEGYTPIDVAGCATQNPIQKLKVLYHLNVFQSPAAVFWCKEVRNNHISKRNTLSFTLQFSEPICELLAQDIKIDVCPIQLSKNREEIEWIQRFTSISTSRYAFTLNLESCTRGEKILIYLPEHVVIKKGASIADAKRSPHLYYNTASPSYTVHYFEKYINKKNSLKL